MFPPCRGGARQPAPHRRPVPRGAQSGGSRTEAVRRLNRVPGASLFMACKLTPCLKQTYTVFKGVQSICRSGRCPEQAAAWITWFYVGQSLLAPTLFTAGAQRDPAHQDRDGQRGHRRRPVSGCPCAQLSLPFGNRMLPCWPLAGCCHLCMGGVTAGHGCFQLSLRAGQLGCKPACPPSHNPCHPAQV